MWSTLANDVLLPSWDVTRTLATKVTDGRLERARGAHRAGTVGRVVVAGLAQALRRAGGAGGRRHAAGRAVGAARRAEGSAIRVERAQRARSAAHARVARLAFCACVVERVWRDAAKSQRIGMGRKCACVARTRASQRRGRARVVGAVTGRALFTGGATRAGAVLADGADCSWADTQLARTRKHVSGGAYVQGAVRSMLAPCILLQRPSAQ